MNWEKDDIFLAKWLNGELSEEEVRAFENSEDGKEFVKMMNASKLLKPTPYPTEEAFASLSNRIESSQKAKTIFWKQPSFQLVIAASVALIIAVAYMFTSGSGTIKTGFSEQEIVMLPDGSEVKLNSASQLSYNAETWNENRSVRLDGEAFFQVKKGSTFNVETANGNVQVLGTSFNVKARRNMLDVACYTGKVEVSSSNITKQLLPGDQIRVKDGEMVEFKSSDLAELPSWANGITQLENLNLSQVIDELTYVFGVTVEYDGSLDHIVYTGAFPNQKAEAAFKLVFEPLNIQYTYNQSSNKLIIIGLVE